LRKNFASGSICTSNSAVASSGGRCGSWSRTHSATSGGGEPSRAGGGSRSSRSESKAIGQRELICTYTGDRSRNCSGTFPPHGKVIVGGPMLFRQLFELAVLGGTGLYNNVRGTLTVTALTSGPHVRDVLGFRLTP